MTSGIAMMLIRKFSPPRIKQLSVNNRSVGLTNNKWTQYLNKKVEFFTSFKPRFVKLNVECFNHYKFISVIRVSLPTPINF